MRQAGQLVSLQMPPEEIHVQVPQVCFFRIADNAVPLAGIGHHFERPSGLLQGVDHLHGVVKKYVVIGHAVNDQQRVCQIPCVAERAG